MHHHTIDASSASGSAHNRLLISLWPAHLRVSIPEPTVWTDMHQFSTCFWLAVGEKTSGASIEAPMVERPGMTSPTSSKAGRLPEFDHHLTGAVLRRE